MEERRGRIAFERLARSAGMSGEQVGRVKEEASELPSHSFLPA